MENYKVLKVTVEMNYLIPIHDDEITKINGWSMEEVIENWFKDHPLSGYHATRDSHEIGGSKKFIKSEIIKSIEI